MALHLANYQKQATESVKAFWGNRDAASRKQIKAGRPDTGTRGSVTGGKNMDGFVSLMIDLVQANGLEDAPRSRSPIRDRSIHFPVRPEFQGASYIDRYNLLCKKLVQEQLYTTTAVLASPKTAIKSGEFKDVSDLTSLKTFVTSFAGHIASEAAR